jgi:hypothetical protein
METLYEMRDKMKRTTYVLEIEDEMMVIEISDYGRFISRNEVILKANTFMAYYERYYKDGSCFSNGIICKLHGETLREVEQAVGATINELFTLTIEKIKKGNIRAFDGLWFLCNVLNPYQRPYWVERVRKHILS